MKYCNLSLYFYFHNFKYNQSMSWCPAPQCVLAIEANHLLGYQQNCKCDCGHQFCFSCGNECHDPLPCDLISKWKKDDYIETVSYLTVNVKICPGCSSPIEKDGGCNCVVGAYFLLLSNEIDTWFKEMNYRWHQIRFQKCVSCDIEFCWRCNGGWDHAEVHEFCSNEVAENEER